MRVIGTREAAIRQMRNWQISDLDSPFAAPQ